MKRLAASLSAASFSPPFALFALCPLLLWESQGRVLLFVLAGLLAVLGYLYARRRVIERHGLAPLGIDLAGGLLLLLAVGTEALGTLGVGSLGWIVASALIVLWQLVPRGQLEAPQAVVTAVVLLGFVAVVARAFWSNGLSTAASAWSVGSLGFGQVRLSFGLVLGVFLGVGLGRFERDSSVARAERRRVTWFGLLLVVGLWASTLSAATLTQPSVLVEAVLHSHLVVWALGASALPMVFALFDGLADRVSLLGLTKVAPARVAIAVLVIGLSGVTSSHASRLHNLPGLVLFPAALGAMLTAVAVYTLWCARDHRRAKERWLEYAPLVLAVVLVVAGFDGTFVAATRLTGEALWFGVGGALATLIAALYVGDLARSQAHGAVDR